MEKPIRFLCGDCQRFVDTMDLKDQTQWERECKEGRLVTPLSRNCRKGVYKGDPHLYAKPKLKRRKLVEFG